MSQQAQNEYYKSEERRAMDTGRVNEEIRDLFAAGADIVQIDDPYMQARPEKARRFGLKALNRALDGIEGTTAVHICFGYAPSSTCGPRAIRSSASSRAVAAARSRSRRRSPISTARC